MIHIRFKEPDNTPKNKWYQDWKLRAAEETQKAIEAYAGNQSRDPYEFDSSIWKKVKRHLFELFSGKCAYCEAKVLHVASGDVEHFRPKKKVTGDEKHHGYYWLAYDLRNLFPSCEKCNRAGAKMNQFPVDQNIRVYSHDEQLSKESPLLLNPYDDEPTKHLKFIPPSKGVAVGTVAKLTQKGHASITTYKLDREELNDRRSAAQQRIISELLIEIVKLPEGRFNSILRELVEGKREFSAASLAAFKHWHNAFEATTNEALKRI